MIKQIKVPSVGESVNQATVGSWEKEDGSFVHQNEVLVVMETDKASMDLVSEYTGKLKILKQAGEEVKIGEVLAEVDISQKPKPGLAKKPVKKDQSTKKEMAAAPSPLSVPPFPPPVAEGPSIRQSDIHLSPAVRSLVENRNLDVKSIQATGPKGNITKADALLALEQKKPAPSMEKPGGGTFPVDEKHTGQTREKMTTIRKQIARRLVQSQKDTATLTTFNELDMSAIVELRAKYKENFKEKHGVKLGFMGFFIKAAVLALKKFPKVNAFIEGDEIVYNHACHVGVAVSTDRGLVVPVIFHADTMNLPELEKWVLYYGEKARQGKLLPKELMGGTFTISNGGVFGSLMSTPILNPPQSGILGLHAIQSRPVVRDGKVAVKPMMYVALSYDHRLVDGQGAVSFLVTLKECIEDPIKLLIDI